MRYFIKSIENLHPLGIYSEGISSQLLLYTSYCLYRIIKVLRYVATHHNPTFNLLKAYLSFLILQHMSGSMISEFSPFFKTKPNVLQSELKSTLNSLDEILEVNKYFYASEYVPLETSRYIIFCQEKHLEKIWQKIFLEVISIIMSLCESFPNFLWSEKCYSLSKPN